MYNLINSFIIIWAKKKIQKIIPLLQIAFSNLICFKKQTKLFQSEEFCYYKIKRIFTMKKTIDMLIHMNHLK